MSRWFRHYAGLCRDEKLVSVAIKAKQPVERVVWVWCAILESAAEIDDNGRYSLDEAEAAYFLRTDEADIVGITTGLEQLGRVSDGVVVKWRDRQFASDRSRERVAAYRERRREAGNDGNAAPITSRNDDVTLQKRHCNAPETETETDITASSAPGMAGLESQLREASKAEQNPSPSLYDLSPVNRCLSAGASLDMDVLPTIRAITARGHRWQSWAYAEGAIMEAKARREAPPIESQPSQIRPKPPPDRPLRGSSAVSAALDRIFPDGQQAST